MTPLQTPSSSRLDILTVPAFAESTWLMHGFSTRAGGLSTVYRSGRPGSDLGDLNLGFTADDDRASVQANRALLLAHMAPANSESGLVTVRQTHSSTVHRVDQSHVLISGSPAALEGDGLMTNVPGVVLAILTADCVPVLVVDRHRRAVAAFHAGWRGTAGAIVEKGVARMRSEFGSVPEDLLAAVGPAIGSCCYTVGEEVQQQFVDRFAYAEQLFEQVAGLDAAKKTIRLNLAEANRRQLLSAGLSEASISMTRACTACHTERFFSHRAEHGITGRMMAVIGIGAA